MIDKLRLLEETLVQVNKQYHVVATELANLKNKPNNDAKNTAIIEGLRTKIQGFEQQISEMEGKLAQSQKELEQADQQNDLLNEENRRLSEENNELKRKNRLAIERAELIQTWLYNIDNAKNS